MGFIDSINKIVADNKVRNEQREKTKLEELKVRTAHAKETSRLKIEQLEADTAFKKAKAANKKATKESGSTLGDLGQLFGKKKTTK